MIPRRALLASACALAAPGSLAATPSLAASARRRGILFGTAVTEAAFARDPAYGALVKREAEAVTPEMALKWSTLRPSADRFDFAQADALLVACTSAGLRMRGHNLVWHLSLPGWLEQDPGDLTSVLAHHIRTVCGRYADRLYAWDVVNEPLRVEDGMRDGMRDTIFLRRMGPDYVQTALRMAAAADPQATLVINEMDVEFEGRYFEARRRALLALLRRIRASGAPLHAVGIESHLKWGQGRFDPGRFGAFLKAIADLGLAIHLTELDVADFRLGSAASIRDEAVADLMRRYLETALAEPAVRVLTVWELADRFSWLSNSPWTRRGDGLEARGCLYDDALQPKPARDAVAAALSRA